MSAEYFNFAHFVVVCATIALVIVSCSLHFEVLRFLTRLSLTHLNSQRRRSMATVLALVWLHAAEIWLFGLGYWLLLRLPASGELVGLGGPSIIEHVYFSAVCYTTVGFGDVVPDGPIRFLVGMEGICGLLLITWSASFTFLKMQEHW